MDARQPRKIARGHSPSLHLVLDKETEGHAKIQMKGLASGEPHSLGQFIVVMLDDHIVRARAETNFSHGGEDKEVGSRFPAP